MRSLLRVALRGLSLSQVRHVPPVGLRTAPPEVAAVYRGTEREFGVLAPPIALHAQHPVAHTAAWVLLREVMLAPGTVDRATKEAVAAAVSEANSCPYCTTVHTGTLRGLVGTGARDTSAAVDAVRAAATWPATPPAPAGHDAPPFAPSHMPEVIGAATALQYFNRVVDVFLTSKPMPPWAPPFMVGPVTRVLSYLIRAAARDAGEPGRSLDLLPDAALPADLSWAAGNPAVAGAFARVAAALDAVDVPAATRAATRAALSEWDGRPPGISRAWADDALSGVPEGERPVARLALLVALAPYQVDDTAVADAHRDLSDRELTGLVSWAAFAAARRTGALVREHSPVWSGVETRG